VLCWLVVLVVPGWAPLVMIVLAGAFSVVCVALGGQAEREFGSKDPSQVSADEWAGQALALAGLPMAGGDPLGSAIAVGLGFVAFRVFDIVKPPPARLVERLPGGWGILLDDLVAGVYANLICQAVLRLWLNSA